MGRRRTKSPTWLPQRVYPHGRQYLYRPPKGKPIPLGLITEPGTCLKRYGEIVGDTGVPPRTLADVIDKYLSEVVVTKSESTQETYRLYCSKLKHGLGHMLPDEVTINDLYAYHSARKAPVRANREITVLGMIYRYAIRWRSATKNPTLGFLYAEELPRERLVTGRERRLFAKHYCPAWLRGYILLKYLTGRRQAEMLKLSTFSEKKDGLAFTIVKKRKVRTITVLWTPRLLIVWNWLKALSRPEKTSMIFWSQRGKTRGAVLSKRGFKSAWQRAQEDWVAAGNTAFWEHDIRGASGSDSLTDERAKELLDHTDVRTTRKHYRRGEQNAKVRALK
jgi:hypothetical protein